MPGKLATGRYEWILHGEGEVATFVPPGGRLASAVP